MLFHSLCFTLFLLITGSMIGQERHIYPATLGAYACDTSLGKILLDQESDRSLIPASCMKIVTTGAALHLLGPDFRFQTNLCYEGHIDAEKTLQGNLRIVGGGDPCLGSDRSSSSLSWEKQIAVWANAVQKLGIQKIQGTVIGDASLWEEAMAVPSWTWEDLGNYYGAGASALSFHENAYTLFFRPGKELTAPTDILRTDPPLSSLQLKNEVRTGPIGSGDRACIYGSEYSPLQIVRGTIPLGVDSFSIRGAIPSPATTCAQLFIEELNRRGIEVLGQSFPSSLEKTTLHTTFSPPISEIVYWTNQESINLYAEHLLKKMGEKQLQEGSTQAGIQAVTQFWKEQGIDLQGFYMADGSGLSRKNLITAKQMVAILQKMKDSPYFPIFYHSLREKEADTKVKTGTMSLIRGCVGYRKEKAFAIFLNQCLDFDQAKQTIDSLLKEL